MKRALLHDEIPCESLLVVCSLFFMGTPHSLSPVILSALHSPSITAYLWINNHQMLSHSSHRVNMASVSPQPSSFPSTSTIAVLASKNPFLGPGQTLGKYCYIFRKSLIIIWSSGFQSLLLEALRPFMSLPGSRDGLPPHSLQPESLCSCLFHILQLLGKDFLLKSVSAA